MSNFIKKSLSPFFLLSKFAKHFASDFGSIVMVGDYHIGFFIILAGFLQPNIILSGIAALVITIAMTKLLKIDKTFTIRTTIYCNALLLGLFVGYLYVLDGMSLLLIVITMSLNILLCFTIDSFFSMVGLPLLSFPFSIIALLLTLTMKKFTAIGHANYYFHEFHPDFFRLIPEPLLHFSKSLGTFFCIPDTGFGLLLIVSVMVYSPLTSIFLIAGFFVGMGLERMYAFTESEFVQQHYYFNFSLIFTAVSGIFLLPSAYSILWAFFATLITAIISISLSSVFNYAAIPVMALPFNLAAFFVLRTIKSVAPRRLNLKPGITPENALEMNRLTRLRHRDGEIGVFLPFSSAWTVQQGIDGEWTHQGKWKHAFDFVINRDGKTFLNNGLELEDYFCFGMPLYSPITGYVVSKMDHLKDNKIEEVDNQNNWGNYLIIKSEFGFFVILAHLKNSSILVSQGQYVYAGQELAACGNSGYSREPHLHIQVQWSPLLGGHTTPFHFLNYFTEDQKAIYHGVPKTNDVISPFVYNYSFARALNFKIGESKRFKFSFRGQISEVSFYHKLDPISGKTYWTDGSSKLFYSSLGSKFYFYEIEGDYFSPLWDLYLAAPSIPIVSLNKLKYEDEIPLKLTHSPLKIFITLSYQLLTSTLKSNTGIYLIDPNSLIVTGAVYIRGKEIQTTFKVDPILGISKFSVGEKEYELL